MSAHSFNQSIRVSRGTFNDALVLGRHILPLLTGEVDACESVQRRLPGCQAATRNSWRIGTKKGGIELRRGFVSELLSRPIDLTETQGLIKKLLNSCRLIQRTFSAIGNTKQRDLLDLNASLQACAIVSFVCHLDRLCALLERTNEGYVADNQRKSPLCLFTGKLRGILSAKLLTEICADRELRAPFESFFADPRYAYSSVFFPAKQMFRCDPVELPGYLYEIASHRWGPSEKVLQDFNSNMSMIVQKLALSTADCADLSQPVRSIRHITNPVKSLVGTLSYFVALAMQIKGGAAVFLPPQDSTKLALFGVQIKTKTSRGNTNLTADIVIPEGQNYLLIKANAVSGTSSILTQIARNQIVHQSGGPIAVDSSSSIGTFRRIVSISPSDQQLLGGEGYFGNTLKQLAPYMEDAGKGDLFILDGVPVGTQHTDNAAITAAILQRLISSGATVIYASKNPAVFKLLETQWGFTSCSFDSADGKKLTLTPNGSSTHSDAVLIDLAKCCRVDEDTLQEVARKYSYLGGKQLLIPQAAPASPSWQQLLWQREVDKATVWGVSENKRLLEALGYRYPKEFFLLSASRKMLLDIKTRHAHGVGQTLRAGTFDDNNQIPSARHSLVAKLIDLSDDDLRTLNEKMTTACSNYTNFVRQMSTAGSRLRTQAKEALEISIDELYGELEAVGFNTVSFQGQTHTSIDHAGLLVIDQAFAIVKSMKRFDLSMATLADEANVLVLNNVTPIVSNGSALGLGTPISFSMNGPPRVAEIVGANSGGKSQLLNTIHLEVFSALNLLPTSGQVTSSKFSDVYVRTSNGGNRAQSSIIGDLNYRMMVIESRHADALVLLDEFDLGGESVTASFRSAMNGQLSKKGMSVVSVTHARAGLGKEQSTGAVAVWRANGGFDTETASWKSDYSFSQCPNPEQVHSHGFDIAKRLLPGDIVETAKRLRSGLSS
jgi:hypothetical protein